AWMLYHVPDVERAVRELARVLRPGGRLVAVTNRSDHLPEIKELLGLDTGIAAPFRAEAAEAVLSRYFRRVEARDATSLVRFPDRAPVTRYARACVCLFGK